MSKRNKNKAKTSAANAEIAAISAGKDAPEKKIEAEKEDYIRRDFKHLFETILLIVILFAALYFYDKQTGILHQMTGKLFSFFQ